jgi:hypothetical protein
MKRLRAIEKKELLTAQAKSMLPADDIKLVAVQYSERVRNEAYPFFWMVGERGGGL